jgi:alpha-N-arabinofuranosidase
MFAALTPDRKFLTLVVVNATESEQKFDLKVSGARLEEKPTAWQLTGNNLDALNRVGQEPQVQVREISTNGASGEISVAPISVTFYRFSMAQTQ